MSEELAPRTDGVVTIRPFREADKAVLIAGRDDVFRRFLGEGSADPRPSACIVVGGEVVGWVDYELGHPWLRLGEVNVGYNLFRKHRGHGYALRAVVLLLEHLAADTQYSVATLAIDPDNERSLALAGRAGFTPSGEVTGNKTSKYFKKLVTRPLP